MDRNNRQQRNPLRDQPAANPGNGPQEQRNPLLDHPANPRRNPALNHPLNHDHPLTRGYHEWWETFGPAPYYGTTGALADRLEIEARADRESPYRALPPQETGPIHHAHAHPPPPGYPMSHGGQGTVDPTALNSPSCNPPLINTQEGSSRGGRAQGNNTPTGFAQGGGSRAGNNGPPEGFGQTGSSRGGGLGQANSAQAGSTRGGFGHVGASRGGSK